MIDRPACIVRIERNARDSFSPPTNGDEEPRSQQFLAKYLQQHPQLREAGRFSIEELSALPSHFGLGSGTQLALAVGRGIAAVCGTSHPATAQIATDLGRGHRSAVGIYGFDLGGLLVDAGKLAPNELGELAAREEFPADWRFLLAWPNRATGLTGDNETAAFRTLEPYPPGLTERLSHLVLTEILPAVRSVDFDSFATAMGEYGTLVGNAFASLQGGVVHRASQPLFDWLRERRIAGVAQTSWGPTLAILQPDETEAQKLADELQTTFSEDFITVMTVAARNRGADIQLGS
jgi:beta-RFAP synthase